MKECDFNVMIEDLKRLENPTLFDVSILTKKNAILWRWIIKNNKPVDFLTEIVGLKVYELDEENIVNNGYFEKVGNKKLTELSFETVQTYRRFLFMLKKLNNEFFNEMEELGN
jgi:hypothetical protein